MERTEQIYPDKSHLGEGPWQLEPDRISWIDTSTGFSCLIRRSSTMGALCGYVAIHNDHPLYGKDYSELNDIQVHGQLSYSDACDGDVEFGICHLTNKEDDVWWLGFACSLEDDAFPRDGHGFLNELDSNKKYRDIEYVTKQVESLARQLKDFIKKST